MPQSAGHAPSRDAIPASPADHQVAEIYDRHAAALYRQALFMLDDERLAGQVASDAIAAECTMHAMSPDDADQVPGRLAASVLWRSQELMAGQAGKDSIPRRPARGCSGSRDPGEGEQRALLGLVVFGGMGYREAAHELEISPSRAAGLLRAALITQASSPALSARTMPLSSAAAPACPSCEERLRRWPAGPAMRQPTSQPRPHA